MQIMCAPPSLSHTALPKAGRPLTSRQSSSVSFLILNESQLCIPLKLGYSLTTLCHRSSPLPRAINPLCTFCRHARWTKGKN